jgi:HEAT repeat protein
MITGETITAVAQTAIGSARALQLGTVLIDDPALPETLRIASLNLLATNDQPTALTVIERACSDLDPDVRQAALAALLIRDAQRGRAALSRAALDTSTPLDARISAVEQLSQIFAEDSQLLLARCARDTTLPLYVQLLSVAGMPTSAFASLSEIVYDAAIHPAVRGIAALRLGSSADTNSSQTLRALLELSDTPHALAEGICAGLAASGRTDAAEPLLKLLQTSASDIELTISAIHALGELRAETATHTLVELVGGGALARLENLIPPGVIDQRVTDLLDTNELPPPLALRLATVYTKGVTPAEQPTTLREFLSYEVDAIRIASAQALAKIGGNTARAGLLSALIDNTVGNTAEHVMDALGRIDGETSAESLGYLATNTDINPMIRWLAVQQLRAHERGEAVMQRSLEQSDLDPFIRGALAEGLGQRRVITALPLLRQIADDSANDQHLRAQAIIGLGLLDEPAAEVVLIRLLSDAKEDVALRALAAEHLPSRLSTEGRRLLRELLRRERMPALIAAGALTVLGRAQDREALPLMLRYCQDERADVARAALKALAELGDASVAPVLVRVAQNPAAEQATRLQAIGTLLRIGGAAYRPLLRAYLEDGPLPLRLQALEHLIQASTSASELLAMVENTIFPLPLRLRLIHACIDRPEAGATLLRIAAQADELQLKVRAITALQHHGHLATSALVALAGDAPAPIRLAALEVLGKIGGTSACMALSTVVEDSTSPDTIRHYALSTLYTAVKRHIDENQSFHSVADKA